MPKVHCFAVRETSAPVLRDPRTGSSGRGLSRLSEQKLKVRKVSGKKNYWNTFGTLYTLQGDWPSLSWMTGQTRLLRSGHSTGRLTLAWPSLCPSSRRQEFATWIHFRKYGTTQIDILDAFKIPCNMDKLDLIHRFPRIYPLPGLSHLVTSCHILSLPPSFRLETQLCNQDLNPPPEPRLTVTHVVSWKLVTATRNTRNTEFLEAWVRTVPFK